MKKIALFLLLACAQLASAQTPQAISYQAIARDANGKPMPNADVTVEFSVLDGSVSGQAVYRERHQTETNPFGLFTLEIGRGTVVSGSFAGIDWGGGAKFMRVEINGNLQGTTQLLAVPYALFAEKTKSSQSLDVPGAQPGQVLKWDANAQKWLPANDEVGPPNSGLTSIATAAPISGDGTTGNPVTLAAGSIGSGQIADGSVQAADLAPGVIPTVPASLPPSGAASGDLTGNYPAPTVAKIQGRSVDNAAPATGQVLKWDGSKWTPQNDIGGGTGDNWGSQTTQTDATLAGDGTTGNPLKIAPQGAANGQFLRWNGAAWLPADVNVSIGNSTINSNQIIDNSITINDLAPGVLPTVAAGAGISVAQNGNTFTVTNAAPDLSLSLTGAGATTVTGAYPNFTVTTPAPEDNSVTNEIQVLSLAGNSLSLSNGGGTVTLPTGTTYTAGVGISLINNTVTNTAPDQTVTLTGAGATTVTGSYPNFTVNTPAPLDNSVTNELQTLILNGNTLSLSQNGGTVTLPTGTTYTAGVGISINGQNQISAVDTSQTNEIQALTLSGDTLKLSNGGGNVKLPAATGWGLTGNTGTNPAENFIGTTDDEPIVFKVDGTERMRLETDGRLVIISSNNSNLFIGGGAGNPNTNGGWNTATGTLALASNTTGNHNTANGYGALSYNTSGFYNTANGSNALSLNTDGQANTAIGSSALRANTTGDRNTATGADALESNTTGSSNTATGYQALFSNTTGNSNTASGVNALYSNTTGFGNVSNGYWALYSNTTGERNTAIGSDALRANTTGDANTAIGNTALRDNMTGDANTATGYLALAKNTIGSSNTAIGWSALADNTTGGANTATGLRALEKNTTGGANTATGNAALYSNTSGVGNVSSGYLALYSNTTGNSNVAVGMRALLSNTTSSNLVAVGDSALYWNTGIWNTAIGSKALYSNTIGNGNTASGYQALYSNTTGFGNTASGHESLYNNLSGQDNTANGYKALQNNSNGSRNTAIGNASLAYNTSGNNNTSVGQDALSDNITGSNNTALGYQAGPLNGFNGLLNTTAMGFGTRISANNTVRIGNSSVTSIGGQVNWTALSDSRIKTHITENIPGLAFIQKLRPVSYRYDIHRQNALAGIVDTAQWEGKYDIEKIQFSGFLAQEVEQAAREVGYDFSGVDAPRNERSLYGLRYAEFTVPLVKAVQEQQQIIEAQRQQLEAQDKVLGEVLARLSALEAAARVAGKPENR